MVNIHRHTSVQYDGGDITRTTHYVGSYETSGSNFERAQVPGGFVTMSDSVFHWYLTDYKGNICGVVNSRSVELEQWQEFYPYGKPQTLLPAYSVGDGSVNDRKFGGKELITAKGFDAYDFEARRLTVSIPRFTQPDPMAEKYYPISLYAYCGGDPVNLVDTRGLSTDTINKPIDVENIVFPNIGPVIPPDLFVGWDKEPFKTNFINQNGYEPTCFDYAKEQLYVVGYQPASPYDQGNIYPYNENTGVNEEQTVQAFIYIEDCITNDKPVMIGVDYRPGSPNCDKTTDHFMVVVGIGNDGKNYLWVYDNATIYKEYGTNIGNRLYFDSDIFYFCGHTTIKRTQECKLTQIRRTILK